MHNLDDEIWTHDTHLPSLQSNSIILTISTWYWILHTFFTHTWKFWIIQCEFIQFSFENNIQALNRIDHKTIIISLLKYKFLQVCGHTNTMWNNCNMATGSRKSMLMNRRWQFTSIIQTIPLQQLEVFNHILD